MRIELPLLKQEFKDGQVLSTESTLTLDLDTSVYSEERWEQQFPKLAEHEGLFDYIERIRKDSVSDRVKVSCMLKAIFCFIDSAAIPTYKDFAKMFNLAAPEYTERLTKGLYSSFNAVLNGSSAKN